MENNVKISVILPIFNEEGNIQPLLKEIIETLEGMNEKNFEIICINDGSTDNSLEVLKQEKEKDNRIRIISHYKNFGQSAALATGFQFAKGEILITLDSDRQNNPKDIKTLLDEFYKGDCDCVCGIRKKRRDSIIRKIASKIANGFRNLVTGDKIIDSGCTFRVFKKSAIKELTVFNGMHRFFPTLLRYKGKKVIEIPIDHRPRTWGKSKYGILDRGIRGFIDCFAIRWLKKRGFPAERGEEIKIEINKKEE